MKTIAIISYWMSPVKCAGANRVNSFVRYFKSIGWRVIQIRPDYKGRFSLNHRQYLFESSPENSIDDYKFKSIDSIAIIKKMFGLGGRISDRFSSQEGKKQPAFFKRVLITLYSIIAFPDNYYFFYYFNRRAVLKICKENDIDFVLSSALPISVHSLGAYVKNHHDCKWIADFRDLYINNPGDIQLFMEQMKLKFLKRVMKNADLLTTVSLGLKSALEGELYLNNDKVRVIYNGFDKDRFKEAKINQPDLNLQKKGLFLGTMYLNQLRSFDFFLENFSVANFFRNTVIRFIGNNDISLLENRYIRAGEVARDRRVLFQPQISSRDVDAVYAESHFLLQFDFEQSGNLSSKIFEYFSTGLPVILYTLTPCSELSDLVRELGGLIVEPGSNSVLMQNYLDSYRLNKNKLFFFSRQQQAQNMRKMIMELQ